MKLHYYKPDNNTSNFGDELNVFIWKKYFSDLFDNSSSKVFFGIGTIIKEAEKYYSEVEEVLVFGSGVRSDKIKILDNVKIIFVRGPLSAKVLEVPKKYITDPAILTPNVFKVSDCDKKKKWKFSYMPHFSSSNDNYKNVFNSIGVNYIDPTDDVEKIIKEINQTKILLTEAMHGAIVADAYRVHWIPIKSYESFNYFKWNDWALSNKLNIYINVIPRFYSNDRGIKFLIKKFLFILKMSKIKKRKPYLSSNEVFNENLRKIQKAIVGFKKDYETN